MPNMQKIKAAFELGQRTRRVNLCSEVFECANSEADIPIPNPNSRKTVDCGGLGKVCPGLSIGCSLCGLFIPGLCGAVCPFAGIFCGSSGYLCAIASGKNPEPAEGETEEGSGDSMRGLPRRLFDLDEDFAKYPQLNLDHLEQ